MQISPCLCGDPACGNCFPNSCFPNASENERLRKACIEKLDRVSCSGFFKNVLAYLLQDESRETNVDDICVTSDKMWLIQDVGDIGFNRFIGPVSELYRNCRGIAEVAGLTEDETQYLLDCIPLPM